MTLRSPLFACLALTLAAMPLSGCKAKSTPTNQTAKEAAGSTSLPPAAPVDPATAGTIMGTVNLKGEAPAPVKIDMTMDPACALAPGDNVSEQYVAKKGLLANVFVYVKSGIPASSVPAGAPPIRVDQKGCRFVPHVTAVQQGGRVEYTNSDPTMHNVHTMAVIAGNENVDVSEGPNSAPATRQYNAPEDMMSIRCNNHPWMQAFVNVAPNPYFAVTGSDGTFRLPPLPPGTYTLAALHEKLGEQDTQITVAPHGTATAHLTFTMP